MLQQVFVLLTQSAAMLRSCYALVPLELKDASCAGGKVYVVTMLIARAAPGKHICRPQLDGQ